MAETYQDVTNSAGVMKYMYDKSAEGIINLEAPTYAKLAKKSNLKPGGLGSVFSVKTQSNFRGGVRNDGEALPRYGYFEHQKPVVTPKYIYHLAEISGPAMERAGGAKMAFLTLLPEVTSEAVEVYGYLRGLSVFRDGTSVIATASGDGSSSTSMTLDDYDKNYQLLEGMYIDAVPSTYPDSGSKTISGIKISYVAPAGTNTITLASAQSWSDGDEIVLMGNRDTTMEKDTLGFDAAFDDGTNTDSYFGVARTSYSAYGGNLITAASERAITSHILQDAYNAALIRGGNQAVKNFDWVMNVGQEEQLAEIVLTGQRFNDTTEFDIGYTGIKVKGQKVLVDIRCPRRKIYLTNWDTIARQVLKEGTWGHIGPQWFSHHGLGSSGKHLFTAMYCCMEEIVCERSNRNAIIDMLKEP